MNCRCTHSGYIVLEFFVFLHLELVSVLQILAKDDIEVIKRIQFIGLYAILAKAMFYIISRIIVILVIYYPPYTTRDNHFS